MRCALALILSILLFTKTFAVRAAPAKSDAKALAAEARTVLKKHCYSCHDSKGTDHGYDFDALKVESLFAISSEYKKPYIVAGDPAKSFLFERLGLRKDGKGDMPPKRVTERPTDTDKDIIKHWIEAKASPFPAASR